LGERYSKIQPTFIYVNTLVCHNNFNLLKAFVHLEAETLFSPIKSFKDPFIFI